MNGDFDFGNLIYILATIVALIAGVFGKKKKPAKGAPAGGDPPKQNFFEKLESQLTGLVDDAKGTAVESEDYEEELAFAEESLAQEPMVFQASEASKEHESPFENYEGLFNSSGDRSVDFISSEATMSSYGDAAMELIDLDDQGVEDNAEIIDGFDLRTAVIFSSILDRPEY